MGTANAKHLINDVLAEVESRGPTIVSRRLIGQAESEQFVMKIPNNKVGLVIGKRGATIKNMQASTAASIQVIPLHLPPGDTSTERIVQIDGTSEQFEAAKQLVNKSFQRIVLETQQWLEDIHSKVIKQVLLLVGHLVVLLHYNNQVMVMARTVSSTISAF
ncbi:hypothetical protein M0R45_029096 [Rubus argutus]|uniref:K Homology domain-containing protein n=1 Tax=Rubus argutus TaxID=59490 RepID=A0AAW1W9E2_RUBAR